MKAQDIMTGNVMTVRPETPIREIAALMVEKHVSGLPVVDGEGHIVGMVSQSDLLHRREVGTERKHKWWFRMLADSNAMAREFVKAHGHTAHDVMTKHIVSVRADADLRDVADILDKQKVKRVPVVRDGKLVGIVTRGDLVRALTLSQLDKPARKIDDAALLKELHDRIQKQAWINKTYVNLTAQDGTVDMWGFVESSDQHRALKLLVEETDGVVKVTDKIKVGVPYRGGI